jgi:hypothetical protein
MQTRFIEKLLPIRFPACALAVGATVFLAACAAGPPPPPPPEDPAKVKADIKAREEFARDLPKPPER